jgi:hypothetical protein
MLKRPLVAIPIVLALAACQDSAGPDANALTREEVSGLAESVVGSTFDLTTDGRDIDTTPPDHGLLPAITTTVNLTIPVPCGRGGQAVFDGSRVRVWDFEVGSRTDDFTATNHYEGCARSYDRSEEGPVEITLDGDVEIGAHHAWLRWEWEGLQTLDIEGSLDWATDDGRDGNCPIDIEARFDPETRTRTVEGTFCDTDVSSTTTWD